MKNLTNTDIKKICDLYQTKSIEDISKEFHIGDRRVKNILMENGIEIRNSHQKTISNDDYIEKNRERFPLVEGSHYIAVLKTDDNIIFEDYLNQSGCLTQYIKNSIGIEIPSLYLRKKYFHEHGEQWYEQWFDIVAIKDLKQSLKKCPYCKWKTIDVENKSGMFMTHLLKEHNKPINVFLKEHPEDKDYFSKQQKIIEKKEFLKNSKNYVLCPICGEKMEKITYWHIRSKHNISYKDFKTRYPNASMISENMLSQTMDAQKMTNLTVSKNRFISKYEREIQDFLSIHNIEFEANRQILIGREIDILIRDKKIGIEFDGLKWHTEFFGKKSHSYHLEKTIKCNEVGYGLIHIFEDEYVNNKDIVLSKISHILNIENKPSIYARKCSVREIYKKEAEDFLNKNHIQGYSPSTVYIGTFYNEKLIGVMTFKNGNVKNKGWDLTRFASDINYNCVGIGGKMFTYFIRNYNPEKVILNGDTKLTISDQTGDILNPTKDNYIIELAFNNFNSIKQDEQKERLFEGILSVENIECVYENVN